ncbi:protein of unknown function (plasmid) [Caballeronia sp. S22]
MIVAKRGESHAPFAIFTHTLGRKRFDAPHWRASNRQTRTASEPIPRTNTNAVVPP